MEPWSNEEMLKTGEFVKKHGIPLGMEKELRQLTQRFAKISKDFDELDEEQKTEKREEFFEAQNVFFGTGAVIANLLVNKDQDEARKGAHGGMQVDEQQPTTSAGVQEIVRTIPTPHERSSIGCHMCNTEKYHNRY